jgi:hypothetical protein
VTEIPLQGRWTGIVRKAWKWSYGDCNAHFPLTFDDGVEWLVRARRFRGNVPEDMIHQVMEHEIATLQALTKGGCLVPRAWKAPSQAGRRLTSDGKQI